MAMRSGLAMAAAAAMMTVSAPAWSIGMSLNYVLLPQHVTLEACLNLAESQFASSGLAVMQRTNSAAWAEPQAQIDEIYSIYCIIDRGIAIVIGSGDDLDNVDQQVATVVQNLDYAFNGK